MFSLLFAVASQATLALPLPEGHERLFLDAQFLPVEEAEAIYLRNEDAEGVGQDYSLDGVLVREGAMVDGLADGLHRYYFPNGELESEKHYELGHRAGEWQWWYDNGKQREIGRWHAYYDAEGERRAEYEMVAFWGPEGNQLIKDGTGHYVLLDEQGNKLRDGYYLEGQRDGEWTWTDADGTVQYRELYDAGDFVVGWRFDGGRSIRYQAIYTQAALPTSWDRHLMTHFGEQLPGEIEAVLSIGPEGRVHSATLLKAPESALEQVETMLLESPNWIPATWRGQPIAVEHSLTLAP
ncbi:toxin-antitoxin system YwqK family antitoxin [Ferrimonas marina]|nr:hypothetical protein [Ferrimonas marina]